MITYDLQMFFCSPLFGKWSVIFGYKSVLLFSCALCAWGKIFLILVIPKISTLKNKIYKDVKSVHTIISLIVISSTLYKQSDWKSPKDLNSVPHVLARNGCIYICRASSCSEDMFFWLGLVLICSVNFDWWKMVHPYLSVSTYMLGCVILRKMISIN